jgi:hypothetical protein
MEHGNALGRAQFRERRFQLHYFTNGFLDETLDRVFTPWLQRRLPKTTPKPLHACKTDPLDLTGLSVQHMNTGSREDLIHFFGLPCLIIVIAEDGDNRHGCRRVG